MVDEAKTIITQRIEEIEKLLPDQLHGILASRDGAALLVQRLPQAFPATILATTPEQQKAWEVVGGFYLQQGRFHEALAIYAALYDQMLVAQNETSSRCHKGMPLVWMSDCYASIGHTLASRRYLMLTLVEDAIRENGSISPETTGTYFRSVWGGGLSDAELKRYASRVHELSVSHPVEALYPEWVLQHVDTDWISLVPSFQARPRNLWVRI